MGAWLAYPPGLPQLYVDVGAKYQLIGSGDFTHIAIDDQDFEGTDFVSCAALDGQLLAE